jgi:hypothetical protein
VANGIVLFEQKNIDYADAPVSSGLSHILMLQRRLLSTPQSNKNDNSLIDIKRPTLLSTTGHHIITKIRGGSSSEESEEYGDDEYEYDSDEYETDEYDSDEEEEEVEGEDDDEEVTSSQLKSSLLSKSQQQPSVVEYDDLLTPPAMQQMMISIGVMMLSNRIDILNPKAVRIARFAFLVYIISVQAFLLYVRLRAKSINDRTPITITNPLASLVQNGAASAGGGGGGNMMVKALADQVLSTQTTILEYDLKQAKKMNGGLLFPMIFLYFLHFKMKQVQPLLMQTASGFTNLVYSPLFQVYVLGRKLERPFKPPSNPMMDALQAQQQNGDAEGGEEAESSEEENGEGEEEEDASDSEEEEDASTDEESESEASDEE